MLAESSSDVFAPEQTAAEIGRINVQTKLSHLLCVVICGVTCDLVVLRHNSERSENAAVGLSTIFLLKRGISFKQISRTDFSQGNGLKPNLKYAFPIDRSILKIGG